MAMLAEKRRKTKFVINPLAKPLWTSESSKIGKQMMEKMGWSAGKGLGASEQGIHEPIRALYKQDSKGMGYSGNGNPFENLDQFNALLSSLSGQVNSEDVAHSFESLEEKSKQSRSRVHYKKFTRSKDVSKYSNVDLSCIVGLGKKVEEEVLEEDVDHTGEEAHSHGVTTINSGSISDYFKIKMKKRKGLLDSAPALGLENENQDDINETNTKNRNQGHSANLNEFNISSDFSNQEKVLESNEMHLKNEEPNEEQNGHETELASSEIEIKKHSKSKKKKRKTKDIEEDTNEVIEVKVKHGRDLKLETDSSRKEDDAPELLFGEENSTKRKKKRRKEMNREKEHEEDLSNCVDSGYSKGETESQEFSQTGGEDIHEDGGSVDVSLHERRSKKKKKKHSHDEKDERNEESNALLFEDLLENKKSRKNKKKSNEIEIEDISVLVEKENEHEKKKKHRKKCKEIVEENNEVAKDSAFGSDNEGKIMEIDGNLDANNDDSLKKKKKRKIKTSEDEIDIVVEKKIKKEDGIQNELDSFETDGTEKCSTIDEQHKQIVEVTKHFRGSNLDVLPGYGQRRPAQTKAET